MGVNFLILNRARARLSKRRPWKDVPYMTLVYLYTHQVKIRDGI